jgi:hypothetical protein
MISSDVSVFDGLGLCDAARDLLLTAADFQVDVALNLSQSTRRLLKCEKLWFLTARLIVGISSLEGNRRPSWKSGQCDALRSLIQKSSSRTGHTLSPSLHLHEM